jgi:hypothetical protein
MTEAEWLSCDSPRVCFQFLAGAGSTRKRILFGCACCRRVWDQVIDVGSRTAIQTSERFVDGLATEEECDTASQRAEEVYKSMERLADSSLDGRPRYTDYRAEAMCHAAGAVFYASRLFTGKTDILGDPAVVATAATNVARYITAADLRPEGGDQDLPNSALPRDAKRAEEAVQASLLRDIFGNPFRPLAFPPEWRTDTAAALSHQMYESRDFSPIPILADALQDAGCDNPDILDHCRDPQGVHVRGCWIVDAVLGKE